MTLGSRANGLFLHLYNGAAHVKAAIAADPVRGHGLSAVGAECQLPRRKKIVGPTGARFLIGLTSLWNCHEITSEPTDE